MMNNTVYADLSRDYSGLDQFKRSVEAQLGSLMPVNSYAVIARNYGGDIRTNSHKTTLFKCIIMLQPEARTAAIEHKEELEGMGYQVSPDGKINLP